MNRLTQQRLAAVRYSGFDTEEDLLEAVMQKVANMGHEAMQNPDLSAEQKHGVASALNDTPIGVSWLKKIAADRYPYQPDDRRNLLFVIAKLVDDMTSLGGVLGGAAERFSVHKAGHVGGKESAKVRGKGRDDVWRTEARTIIQDVRSSHPSWSRPRVAKEVEARFPRIPVERRSIIDLVKTIDEARSANLKEHQGLTASES